MARRIIGLIAVALIAGAVLCAFLIPDTIIVNLEVVASEGVDAAVGEVASLNLYDFIFHGFSMANPLVEGESITFMLAGLYLIQYLFYSAAGAAALAFIVNLMFPNKTQKILGWANGLAIGLAGFASFTVFMLPTILTDGANAILQTGSEEGFAGGFVLKTGWALYMVAALLAAGALFMLIGLCFASLYKKPKNLPINGPQGGQPALTQNGYPPYPPQNGGYPYQGGPNRY
jgi:hypothetical protein